MSKEKQDRKDIILKEYQNENIVISTIDGIQKMPLKDFIKQPSEGILYDLNRSESVALTFIDDPKWVNDFAVAKVIKALKDEIEILTASQSQEESKWISVKDQLPNEGIKVIGYFPNGDESGERISTAHYNINTKSVTSDFPNSTSSYFEATHWQPFPSAPIKQIIVNTNFCQCLNSNLSGINDKLICNNCNKEFKQP